MTAYIEWIEPYSNDRDDDSPERPLICRMAFKDIVFMQFQRHPRYASAQQALDDFMVICWGRVVK